MAVTPNSIISVQTPKVDIAQFSTALGAFNLVTLSTGGSNGSKIVAVILNNSESSTHNVRIDLVRSGQDFFGTAVSVPGNAGYSNGVPPINAMSPANWPGLPVDADGNPYILLPSTTDQLAFTTTVGLSTGNVINAMAIKGDF